MLHHDMTVALDGGIIYQEYTSYVLSDSFYYSLEQIGVSVRSRLGALSLASLWHWSGVLWGSLGSSCSHQQGAGWVLCHLPACGTGQEYCGVLLGVAAVISLVPLPLQNSGTPQLRPH